MSSAYGVYGSSVGFESQITLVDTSAYGTPHTIVSFIRDDMKNTKIISADERPLFMVTTDALTNSRTTIYRCDAASTPGDSDVSAAEVVAEIKRKDLRADRIKFVGETNSTKLSNWLRGSTGKWSDFPASFEWRSSKYIWKTNSARQIALYDEVDQARPIAWFQTSRRDTIDGVPTVFRALLALQPEAEEMLDAVIVSLLIVEHRLRWREMKYQNADGLGTFKHSI